MTTAAVENVEGIKFKSQHLMENYCGFSKVGRTWSAGGGRAGGRYYTYLDK